jgi:hypothetical protein
MAELEPGNPDELCQMLVNWLNQANDSSGTLLPVGISPTEWAVRQFIKAWRASPCGTRLCGGGNCLCYFSDSEGRH